MVQQGKFINLIETFQRLNPILEAFDYFMEIIHILFVSLQICWYYVVGEEEITKFYLRLVSIHSELCQSVSNSTFPVDFSVPAKSDSVCVWVTANRLSVHGRAHFVVFRLWFCGANRKNVFPQFRFT